MTALLSRRTAVADGTRRSLRLHDLQLESGVLPEATVSFETAGRLAPDGSNAVLVAHALTGDAHLTSTSADPSSGWWQEVVGPGRAINTDHYFVICSDVIGGCTGSTGPCDTAPDGAPWGSRFPRLSIRDMARVDLAVLDHLGVDRVRAVIGASMGGARAMETALLAPERVEGLVVIAAPPFSQADQIAWAHAQLGAIALDPDYAGGDYLARGTRPRAGLALARQIAHMTYRSDTELNSRFARELQGTTRSALPRIAQSSGGREAAPYYRVESYLDHHGSKLVERFDAESYVLLTEALSGHDVRRGRAGDLAGAVAGYRGRALVVSLASDRLYPPEQVRSLAEALPGPVRHAVVRSRVGHDGFLTEHETIGAQVRRFLTEG